MAYRVQHRRDTLANWLKNDPVLLDGEVVLIASDLNNPKVYDTKKVGNGSSKFSELPTLGYECLQELGDDVHYPMSQQATSKEINSLKSSDSTHDNRILELEKSQWPLQLSLISNKSLLDYTLGDQKINLTYTVKRKNLPKNIYSGEIVKNKIASYPLTKGTNNGTLNELVVSDLGDNTFVLNVSAHSYYEDSSTNTSDLMQGTTNCIVKMVLPIYAGFGSTWEDVAIQDSKRPLTTNAAGMYSYTCQEDQKHFFILVPMQGISQVQEFTMGGAPYVMNVLRITINGQYYMRYQSGAVYNKGAQVNIKAQ